MGSIRSRLTAGFAAALLSTMILFALALLLERRVTTLRDLDARLAAKVEQTASIVDGAPRILGNNEPLVVSGDSSTGVASVSDRLRTLLEIVPDYVLVKGARGYGLYASRDVHGLDVKDADKLDSVALAMPDGTETVIVDLSRVQLLLATRRLSGASTNIDRVWVGVPTKTADLFPRDVVSTMLAVAPFLLAISMAIAYAIAGRAFQPIDHIIDQVQAISDGRSLHRRLSITAAGDELARLSSTLNAMIERLETSFGALRRFTADASHELKTPLTVIRADVERAMSPNASSTERAVALEEALQQVTRMADLVDSLLTLARADEGRFDLYREPVDLVALLREVVETARLLGEDAGLTIEVPIVHAATVQGDLTRLRQLFLNLVTNAIKYTPRGGKVEITLVVEHNDVLFAVRDTGIGISAADLPYVFERFWRADRVRSRAAERGGFGLGLAISQWIAQAHGGTLTVESRLTRGSRFVLCIPLSHEADHVTGAPV